jgi:hypothetical protein
MALKGRSKSRPTPEREAQGCKASRFADTPNVAPEPLDRRSADLPIGDIAGQKPDVT